MRQKTTSILFVSRLGSAILQSAQIFMVVGVVSKDQSGFVLVTLTFAYVISALSDFGLTTQMLISHKNLKFHDSRIVENASNHITIIAIFGCILFASVPTTFSLSERIIVSGMMLAAMLERNTEIHFMKLATNLLVSRVAILTVSRRAGSICLMLIGQIALNFEPQMTFVFSNLVSALAVNLVASRGKFQINFIGRGEISRLFKLVKAHSINNFATQIKMLDLPIAALVLGPLATAGMALGSRLAAPLQIFFGSAGTSNLLSLSQRGTKSMARLLAQEASILIFFLMSVLSSNFAVYIMRMGVPWFNSEEYIIVLLVLLKFVYWGRSIYETTNLVNRGGERLSARVNGMFSVALFSGVLLAGLFLRDAVFLVAFSAVIAFCNWLVLFRANRSGLN